MAGRIDLDDPQYDMEKSLPPQLPYKCPVCVKAFRTEEDLTEHQRVNSHFRPAVETPSAG